MMAHAQTPTGTTRVWPQRRRLTAILAFCLGLAGQSISPAAAQEFRLLQLDGLYLKWGSAAFRTPARISYAVLRADTANPEAINCKRMTDIAALQTRAGISDRAFQDELAAAFDIWRQAAGLVFTQTDDTVAADIIIGAQMRPRGIAYTNVDYTSTEDSDFGLLSQAVVCLNPEAAWEIEADADLATYNLRRVLAHEIGHALGLNHPGRDEQLMGFAYATDIAQLNDGDILGIRTLYGMPAGTTDGGVYTASSR